MSTKIRASCPVCGDVELSADKISLTVYSNCHERDYFSFQCPGSADGERKCGDVVAKSAPNEIVQVLTEHAGVVPNYIHIPAEALEEHNHPPLTEDDILDAINEGWTAMLEEGLNG